MKNKRAKPKAKMGRPRQVEAPRSVLVALRLTRGERAALRCASRAEKLDLSAFIRAAALQAAKERGK